MDRDDHTVRGDERVHGQEAQRGWRVDQDEVVLGPDREQRLVERALAADHARQRQLGAGQVDRGHGQVDLAVVDDLLDRQLVHEDVVHRALDRVRVQPLAHRQVALRVEIDDENLVPLLGERDCQVQRRSRLRNATLLVGESDDPAQWRSFRGSPRFGTVD